MPDDFGVQCMQLFCGMLARIEQFADVMRDSKLQLKQVTSLAAAGTCRLALCDQLNNTPTIWASDRQCHLSRSSGFHSVCMGMPAANLG